MQRDLLTAPQVLVACERSGIVRDAFLELGFDAWSCDIEADDHGSNRHIRDDVRKILGDGWDMLIVAHPPCTRLCNSGVRWLTVPPPGKTLEQMWAELEEGAELFSTMWNAEIPHLAVENPIMHRHARERIAGYQDPAQIVQPWWFGDPVFKATGLYLRNLPPLHPTNKLTPPAKGTDEHKAWSKIHRMSRTKDRARKRSEFFPGVARAMASQWGTHILRNRLGRAA